MLLKPVLPVVSYVVNYEYIAKELCVNKAKPQMHCNGKCHLMKELAKAAEQEKPLSEKKSVHTEVEVLFCQAVAHYSFACYLPAATKQNLPVYSNLYSKLNCSAVFHPPLIIS
ncbi:hypothetical protein FMM05_07425 [Flavobacterium zepuense]|uniref:Uncharacterized protein n=2 Tax=Flavobacterium zepuense TaxID=2593302 RepID=A0A552V4M3_9FLAO|nr:hypothetical protein FMM05_07425 [Flavobacterium zepuense]